LSTTLVKFEENHDNLDEELKTKPPLFPMTIINRFEKNCGTFKRREEKTQCVSMTLG
jgi:hypothetical protein